jgi:3-deoxy-D-manno-octulosonate 8-phosphate phosphatase (KDO 8-P phosphatase)
VSERPSSRAVGAGAPAIHANLDDLHPQAMERAAAVRLMMFDIDGVFTDGRLLVGPQGEVAKTFDTLDGHGVKLLAQAGVVPAIITGRQSEIVAWRARELGIAHVYQGVHDKRTAFADLLAKLQLTPAECGYMGDDWPDLPVMVQVGFPVCPAQAHAEVKARSRYVCANPGGRGAVREVCDLLLKAHGAYDTLLAQTLAAST